MLLDAKRVPSLLHFGLVVVGQAEVLVNSENGQLRDATLVNEILQEVYEQDLLVGVPGAELVFLVN